MTRLALGEVVKQNNEVKYFWRSGSSIYLCLALLVLVGELVFILLLLVVQVKDSHSTLLACD